MSVPGLPKHSPVLQFLFLVRFAPKGGFSSYLSVIVITRERDCLSRRPFDRVCDRRSARALHPRSRYVRVSSGCRVLCE